LGDFQLVSVWKVISLQRDMNRHYHGLSRWKKPTDVPEMRRETAKK